jgi:ribose transport system substrate-binding protein
MKKTPMRASQVLVCIALLALVLSACGSSGSSSSSSTPNQTTAKASDSAAEAKQAASVIAPYIGKPSAFPVTEPLTKAPKGKTIAYMDCGTPVCALVWQLVQPAAATMGVKLDRIKSGLAANTVSAAFDSVVAKKPAGVMVMATPIALWSKQLAELKKANIPVVVEGVAGAEAKQYGVPAGNAATAEANALAGKLLANYVVAKFGADANVVVYQLPEVGVTKETAAAVESNLKAACSKCAVRTADVSAATLGNKAASVVVSDLQAHPDATVAVFTSDEIQIGLPAALKAAGIDVKTLGYGPGPLNLQQLKDGKETAALASDFPVLIWATLDQLARQTTGQKLKGDEAKGIGDLQFLTSSDITSDPSKGWTGYPDFAQRFGKLWGGQG